MVSHINTAGLATFETYSLMFVTDSPFINVTFVGLLGAPLLRKSLVAKLVMRSLLNS